jgi:ubiquinone/menaquinone biosynthesis C-methylase UbiE
VTTLKGNKTTIMTRELFKEKLKSLFNDKISISNNSITITSFSEYSNQQQTNDVFSEKWTKYEETDEKEKLYAFQKEWYLDLYGFNSTEELKTYLESCQVILDAGCGLGYKAAWFAELAPTALVIGMDFSDSVNIAAATYSHLENLYWMKGDIAKTGFKDGTISYVNCDQVIMHTEKPEQTFAEFVRICAGEKGQIACYFYAKKALPRELLDDHFRIACKDLDNKALWDLSEQLTDLGKTLSELDIKFESPDIPLLGIKGGSYDIQRFIYWNFLKCFWNEGLGRETSVATNFDWYSPSNARRFSEMEVRKLISDNKMRELYFHAEEACYSGRFVQV